MCQVIEVDMRVSGDRGGHACVSDAWRNLPGIWNPLLHFARVECYIHARQRGYIHFARALIR